MNSISASSFLKHTGAIKAHIFIYYVYFVHPLYLWHGTVKWRCSGIKINNFTCTT